MRLMNSQRPDGRMVLAVRLDGNRPRRSRLQVESLARAHETGGRAASATKEIRRTGWSCGQHVTALAPGVTFNCKDYKRKDTTMPFSDTELLILAVLQARELYGREVMNAVAELTHGKRKISLGGLYTTLHRMETKG